MEKQVQSSLGPRIGVNESMDELLGSMGELREKIGEMREDISFEKAEEAYRIVMRISTGIEGFELDVGRNAAEILSELQSHISRIKTRIQFLGMHWVHEDDWRVAEEYVNDLNDVDMILERALTAKLTGYGSTISFLRALRKGRFDDILSATTH